MSGTLTIHWTATTQPGDVTVVTVEDREAAEAAAAEAKLSAEDAAASLGASVDGAFIRAGRLILTTKDGVEIDAGAVSTSEAILAASQALGSSKSAAAAAAAAEAAANEAAGVANSSVTAGAVVGDSLVLRRKNGDEFVAGDVRGPKGDPGSNTVPTASAVESEVTGAGTGTRQALDRRYGYHLNVKDYGAVGNGVADDRPAIVAALAAGAPLGRPVYFPAGTYKMSATIAIPAGTGLIADGDATIDFGAVTSAFTAAGVNGVLIEGLKFVAASPTSVVLTASAGTSNVTIRRCVLKGPRLISANPGVTYANADAAICTDFTITDNVCTGVVGGPDLACMLIVYVRRARISNNTISLYRHGIQYWGGNSNPAQQGAPTNARKCGDLVITGNNVFTIGMGGIWGSMGENIAISGNAVRDCGDVCIDVEGSWNCAITGNTVVNGYNGGIAMFFYNRGVTISGNTVVTTQAGRLTIGIYNSGDNVLNVGIVISGNTIIAVGAIAQFGHDGAFDITVVGNTFRNVKVQWDANNFRLMKFESNIFTFDVVSPEPFTALQLARPRGGARVAPQVAKNNFIASSANQPAGSVGIHAYSDSFNEDNVQEIVGNNIGGFPIDIQVTAASENAGRTQAFHVKDNLMGSGVLSRVDAGTGASRVVVAGNRRHNLSPWPEAVPTATDLKWDAGTRMEFRAPAAGGYTGAICTTSGSPGVWKNYGLILA